MNIVYNDLFSGEPVTVEKVNSGAFIEYRKSDQELKNCCNCKFRFKFDSCRKIGKATGSAAKINFNFICNQWEPNPKYFS